MLQRKRGEFLRGRKHLPLDGGSDRKWSEDGLWTGRTAAKHRVMLDSVREPASATEAFFLRGTDLRPRWFGAGGVAAGQVLVRTQMGGVVEKTDRK